MGDTGVTRDNDRVCAYIQHGGDLGYVQSCIFAIVAERDRTDLPLLNRYRCQLGGGRPRYILEPLDGFWLSKRMAYHRLKTPYSTEIESLLWRHGYEIRGQNKRSAVDQTASLDDPVECLCTNYDFPCPVCVADHLELDFEDDAVVA